jgi:hypothetical protein
MPDLTPDAKPKVAESCPTFCLRADESFAMELMVVLTHGASAKYGPRSAVTQKVREKMREFEIWLDVHKGPSRGGSGGAGISPWQNFKP